MLMKAYATELESMQQLYTVDAKVATVLLTHIM